MTITKTAIREMECSVPGCIDCGHQLRLRQLCHPQANIVLVMDRQEECLIALCGKCEAFVCKIAVAEDEKWN